jgi:LysM repeat protein
MNKKINNLLLMIVLIVVSAMSASGMVNDSTGFEKKDGKIFVIHKVEPKETLYSVSRRYGVSVDDIKKFNPAAAAGLKVGQVIKVPSKATAASTPVKVQTTQTTQTVSTSSTNPKTHKVAAKETLYSISRKYGVSVDALKKSNPGIEAGLRIGQNINIPAKELTAVVTTTNTVTKTDNTSTASDTDVVKKDTTKTVAGNVIKDVVNNNTNAEASKKIEDLSKIQTTSSTSKEGGYTKITETGVAEMMSDNTTTPKYLALHRTAAVGTIIEVLNQNTNQKIFVKVIGPITDPAEANVIIKISQKAFQRLSGDKKIKVEISYIP